MKIVFLSDDFPPTTFGGAGISTFELALGMKKTGHEVAVITTCRQKSEAGEGSYRGLTVYRIQSNYSGRWRPYISIYNPPVVRELKQLLEKLQPDVVHANNIHQYLSYHSLKVSKAHSKRVLITFRDTMAVTYGKLETERYLLQGDAQITWMDTLRQAKWRWNPLRNILIKQYLRYTDARYAVSEALAKALRQNGITSQVLHTGLRPEEWYAPEQAEAFQQSYGLYGKKIVLFSGRLSAAKGGDVALLALKEVAQAVPGVVLVVAGIKDAYGEAMQAEAEVMGIQDRIVFTGWLSPEKVKAAYAAADIVLVPSRYLDPFPRVVLEAMGAGKPVVATCYGGAPEVVQDGITGYIVNPLRPSEIAEKCVQLLYNPMLAQALGRQARERIQKDFNLDDKLQELLKSYEY